MNTGLREIRFKFNQALALEEEDNFNTSELSFLKGKRTKLLLSLLAKIKCSIEASLVTQ